MATDRETQVFVEMCRADASYSPIDVAHERPSITVDEVKANALDCMAELVRVVDSIGRREEFEHHFDVEYLPTLIRMLRNRFNFEVS